MKKNKKKKYHSIYGVYDNHNGAMLDTFFPTKACAEEVAVDCMLSDLDQLDLDPNLIPERDKKDTHETYLEKLNSFMSVSQPIAFFVQEFSLEE